MVGARATIASESLSVRGRLPSSRGCRCCCCHRRGLHCRLITVVAASPWWPSSLSLAAVVVMGHAGFASNPAAAAVAEVSMWDGGLGGGMAMVGVALGQQCGPAINVSAMWA